MTAIQKENETYAKKMLWKESIYAFSSLASSEFSAESPTTCLVSSFLMASAGKPSISDKSMFLEIMHETTVSPVMFRAVIQRSKNQSMALDKDKNVRSRCASIILGHFEAVVTYTMNSKPLGVPLPPKTVL